MNTEIIKNIVVNNFSFLHRNGYLLRDIHEGKGYKYQMGISYYNDSLNQEVNFAFYDKNPLNNEDNSIAFFLAIFKSGAHIDFSRLLSHDLRFVNYCNLQYFIIPSNKSFEHVLSSLAKVIQEEYIDIINGIKWIEISYDPRDDYR